MAVAVCQCYSAASAAEWAASRCGGAWSGCLVYMADSGGFDFTARVGAEAFPPPTDRTLRLQQASK